MIDAASGFGGASGFAGTAGYDAAATEIMRMNPEALARQAGVVGSTTSSGVRVLRSADEIRKLYENPPSEKEAGIKKVADQFVSILYQFMFKEMDKTVKRTGFLDGGHFEETFRPMLMNEYSKSASTQGGTELNQKVFEYLYDSSSKKNEVIAGLDMIG